LDQVQKDNAAQLAEVIIANGEPHKDSETRILRLSGKYWSKASDLTNNVDGDSKDNMFKEYLLSLYVNVG